MRAIEAKNLTVRFDGQPVLRDITFQVEEGDFLAIVGPNGAGKSTFLKVMLGLVKPSAGSLHLYGKPCGAIPPDWVGYVPQIKTLDRSFPAQTIELVVSGLRRRWPGRIKKEERETAIRALGQVDAAHLAERSLASLSGGELQRAYLAFGLVRRPRLVIMDEPAASIDVVGKKSLYGALEEYRSEANANIVMVTHDWGVAHHHADCVMVLNCDMISFGPPREALRDEHLQKAYGHIGHGIFAHE